MKIPYEDCKDLGGHCFKGTGITLASYPPQHPEVCKHCGATRTGTEQPSLSYTDVRPPREAKS